MEGVDTSAVADALWDGASADVTPPTPSEPAAQPEAPQSHTEVEAGATPETEDSFTKIDLTAPLPEDPAEALAILQAAQKAMQGDYTRKTQAIAEQRKQFESLGVDPSQAAEAVQFVEALQSDPNYAYQVHQALSTQLQQMGYSFNDAQAIAGQQMNEFAQNDGFSQEDPSAEFGSDPRDLMLADMYQRMQQFEQQQQMSQMAADLQRAEMSLRQTHPDYTDSDIDRIYELAMAHDGDLHAADKAYQSWRTDVLSQYVNARTSAPAAPPASTGPAQTPEPIGDFQQAKAAAREMLFNALNAG